MARPPALLKEVQRAERAVDTKIAEARTLMPTQRLALLDTLIDASLDDLKSAAIETWLGRLEGTIDPSGKASVKRMMEFMQEGSGILTARAKMIGVATQAIREMGNLVRKEIKTKPQYDSYIEGMTLEDIAACTDEDKLKALAGASLKRLADRGLLTRSILNMAADSLPPDIIPTTKAEAPAPKMILPPDPEPIVLEPAEVEHVPL